MWIFTTSGFLCDSDQPAAVRISARRSRARRLAIVHWHSGLLRPFGYAQGYFTSRDRAGVCSADLTIMREEPENPELIVHVLTGGRPDALDVLAEWATALGYARVWMPDRVLERDGAASVVGTRVGARCPSCRSRWAEGEPEFWLSVRQWGNFPAACPLCGGDLHQWVAVDRGGSLGAGGAATGGATRCDER